MIVKDRIHTLSRFVIAALSTGLRPPCSCRMARRVDAVTATSQHTHITPITVINRSRRTP